jgi:hypothetical protein
MCGRHSLQIVKHRARFCRASVDDRGTSALYDGDDAVRGDKFLPTSPSCLVDRHRPTVRFAADLSDLRKSGRDNLSRAYFNGPPTPSPAEAKGGDDDREKGDRNAANH